LSTCTGFGLGIPGNVLTKSNHSCNQESVLLLYLLE